MTCVDQWQIYGQSLQHVKAWYEELKMKDLAEEGGQEPTEENDLTVDEEHYMAAAGGFVEGAPPKPQLSVEPTKEPATETGDSTPETGESVTEAEDPAADPAEPSEGETAEPGENGDPAMEQPPEGEEQPPAEPVFMTVEDDYFADAVFIGDSRTVGMWEYGGLEEVSTFYASTGLSVYKVFSSDIVSVPGERKKITVEEALQENTFAKIYLMLGINEMGTGTVETFIEKYAEVVAHLQELQPDAIIYLQGIIKVTTARSEQGDYINNEGIVARNDGIAQLADNVKVFYLDVNPLICDETGGMVADYTFDGVHLKAKYIEIWKDYLKSHAISS